MKSIFKTLLASGCLFIAITSSYADNMTSSAATHGFYLGGAAGFGATSCGSCSSTGSTSNNGFASDIFAGYQVNSYLAFETGAGVLPQVQYSINIPAIPPFGPFPGSAAQTYNSNASANHFYGAIKGIFPVQDKFGLFVKAGYDWMSIKSASLNIPGATTSQNYDAVNATGVLFAIGANVNLKPNLALTLAYNQILDSTTTTANAGINVGYAALGLTVLF